MIDVILSNLRNLCSEPLTEEILKRGGMYLVVPEPKEGKDGEPIYKKTKAGRLWTMGRYKTRKKAVARLKQIEAIKHAKGLTSKAPSKGGKRGKTGRRRKLKFRRKR